MFDLTRLILPAKAAIAFAVVLFFAFTLISPTFAIGSGAIGPLWFMETEDDAVNLYGTGQGFTKDEAILNALNQVASRLSTTLSSSVSSLAISKRHNGDEEFSKEVTQKIEAKTRKMEFNDYELEEVESENNKVYVLVAIDRQKLIGKLSLEVETALKTVEQNDQRKDTAHHLLQHIAMDASSLELLGDVLHKALLVDTLSGGEEASYKAVSDAMLSHKKSKADATASLLIHVGGEKQEKQLISALSNMLTKQGFALGTGKCAGDNCVNIVIESVYDTEDDGEVAKSTMECTINTMSSGGVVIAERLLEFSGVSFKGKKASLKKVNKKALKHLKESSFEALVYE